ncbi:MAG TPA: triose-phosphate isomerase [Rhizomicrobium sp.]|jgi:triosephosphate isomerase|nr:triose-phosphate isomerase [Rhizomicrobium sp.]
MRPLIAGNWKMHGTAGSLGEVAAVAKSIAEEVPPCEVLICPPFTLIARATAAAGRHIALGGQNCHAEPFGAFTGDVSAEMLADAGATAVIVGHSERRRYHGETDIDVAMKTNAAWRAGLFAIVCIGETEDEHDHGRTEEIVARQLDASLPLGAGAATTAIAYEPIWAIGSGRTPPGEEIAAIHELIRKRLSERLGEDGFELRILYGGSVKPANAASILCLPNVNGALVGGASLKAEEFLSIIRAVPRS